MMIEGCLGIVKLCIFDGGEWMNYKFCVDVIFGFVVKIYVDKVLLMVLMGMGVDGCEGVCMLKSVGVIIWVQDEESCVVYGML